MPPSNWLLSSFYLCWCTNTESICWTKQISISWTKPNSNQWANIGIYNGTYIKGELTTIIISWYLFFELPYCLITNMMRFLYLRSLTNDSVLDPMMVAVILLSA